MTPELKSMDYLTGRVPVHPWVEAKRQRFYVYAESHAVASGAANFQIDLQIDADSHFLIEGVQMLESVAHQGSALQAPILTAKVKIVESTLGRAWSSDYVPIYDAAGLGFSQKVLPEPNIVRPSSTISVFVQSVNTGARTFFVALYGRKVYGLSAEEETFLTRRLCYQYVLNIPNKAAGTLNIKPNPALSIYNDSDFLVKRLYASSILNFIAGDGYAGAAVNNDITFTLTDLSKNLVLFSAKTPVRCVAGSQYSLWTSNTQTVGAQPMSAFNLLKPYLLRRNAILDADFDNLTAATTSGLSLVLEGPRLFVPAREVAA
jgi:hypothetical protein